MVRYGQYLIIAGASNDYVAVNIWNVSNPQSPSFVTSISNDYQYVYCHSLAVIGTMLYAGVTNFEDADHKPFPTGTGRFIGVMAIDISTISSPTIEAFHETLGTTPFDIRTDGTYLYVSCKDYMEVLSPAGQLYCLEYYNQTADFKKGEIITGVTTGARGVIVDDNDLGTEGTLTIYRTNVTAFDDTELLDGSRGGAAQVDNRNPPWYYASTDVYMERIGYYGAPSKSLGIDVVGNHAYIADGAKLWIIDISDIENPIKLGHCHLRYFDTGVPGQKGYAYDVRVVGNTAYVACGNRGLVLVDVSNKLNPVETKTESTSLDARGLIYVSVNGTQRIIVGDATAYNGAFHVYTLGGSLQASITGLPDGVHKFAHGPSYEGDTLYINYIDGVGYRSYDINNPDSPVYISTALFNNYGRGMDAGDGLLWAAIIGEWDKTDTWYPNRMLRIGNEVVDTDGPYDIKVHGDRAFIATGNGLKVYDLDGTGLNDPVLLCQYTGVDARALYVDAGSRVCYLACDVKGLVIVRYDGSISYDDLPGTSWTNGPTSGAEELTWYYSTSEGSSWAWYSCNVGEPPYDYGCGPVAEDTSSGSAYYSYWVGNCPNNQTDDFIFTLRVRNCYGARASYSSIHIVIYPGTKCD